VEGESGIRGWGGKLERNEIRKGREIDRDRSRMLSEATQSVQRESEKRERAVSYVLE